MKISHVLKHLLVLQIVTENGRSAPCPTACGKPVTNVPLIFNITKSHWGTGEICPEDTTKQCAKTPACPSPCVVAWTPVSCPTHCAYNGDDLIKHRSVIKPTIGTGKACLSPQTIECDSQDPCPSPCVYSWTPSTCPTKCAYDGSSVYDTLTYYQSRHVEWRSMPTI